MEPGVDIIVVNHRTPGDLQGFLTSLQDNRPRTPHSITIVNVDPLEADRQVAQNFPLPHCGIEFPTNVGYAKAVNRAATTGQREVLAIFNADIILLERVVDQCCAVLQSKETWGILGPRSIDSRGLITHAGFFSEGERGFHHPNSHEFSDVRDDAVTVSGAAFFIKRNLWQELTDCPTYRKQFPNAEGAFMPSPLYYEETWCSYHARAHGHKVVYYGPVVTTHEWNRAARGSQYAREALPKSKLMFEQACEAHGIP